MIAEFHWKATNRFGQKHCGKCLAESRDALEKQLLSKGYTRLAIQRNFILPQNPKTETITQTLNQISLLLNAAIPLKTALTMVCQNSTNIRLYHWLQQLIADLEKGFAFSVALEKQSKFLNSQEIQLIKMGETSGQIPQIFCKLVETRSKSEKLQKKVKKMLFYPVIILTISLLLSLGLLLFIVPKFVDLYSAKTEGLPLLTEILFALSNFLTQHLNGILISSTILLSLLYFIQQKTVFLTPLKNQLLNHTPIFKQIIKKARIIFFCQNCALMLQAHLRLNHILETFLQQKEDTILKQEIKTALTLLKQGYALSEGLNPTVFNQDVIQMISIGEKSGKLADMLFHISDIYQQQLDYQMDLLSQLLEPLLMVVIGAIVGTILIGLYLPIFDMGALVE